MSTLSVTNVSKQFPTRGEPLQVLRDVSLEMKAGENLAILGPSGCGKSVLLKHLVRDTFQPEDYVDLLNEEPAPGFGHQISKIWFDWELDQ